MPNQVLPSIESVDGSDPLATLQNPMARLEAKEEEEEEEEDTEEEEEDDGEDTDLDDWEPDPPRPFDPHDLCKCRRWALSHACASHVLSPSHIPHAVPPALHLSSHSIFPTTLGGRLWHWCLLSRFTKEENEVQKVTGCLLGAV